MVVPCRYEPGLQRTYAELAQHYGTVIVPARPAHARDKAKVEVAVQVVERWILARLRHETVFSLAALNARIAELLADLNARPMRLYRASRRELFERLDGHRGASLTSHEKLLERPALVRDAYHISLRAPVSPSSSVVRRRDKGPA